MVLVDDLRQLPPVHHLLVHPHPNLRLELGMLLDVGPDNAGNGRAPTRVEKIRTLNDRIVQQWPSPERMLEDQCTQGMG